MSKIARTQREIQKRDARDRVIRDAYAMAHKIMDEDLSAFGFAEGYVRATVEAYDLQEKANEVDKLERQIRVGTEIHAPQEVIAAFRKFEEKQRALSVYANDIDRRMFYQKADERDAAKRALFTAIEHAEWK